MQKSQKYFEFFWKKTFLKFHIFKNLHRCTGVLRKLEPWVNWSLVSCLARFSLIQFFLIMCRKQNWYLVRQELVPHSVILFAALHIHIHICCFVFCHNNFHYCLFSWSAVIHQAHVNTHVPSYAAVSIRQCQLASLLARRR